jgi:hypothetical protein
MRSLISKESSHFSHFWTNQTVAVSLEQLRTLRREDFSTRIILTYRLFSCKSTRNLYMRMRCMQPFPLFCV